MYELNDMIGRGRRLTWKNLMALADLEDKIIRDGKWKKTNKPKD